VPKLRVGAQRKVLIRAHKPRKKTISVIGQDASWCAGVLMLQGAEARPCTGWGGEGDGRALSEACKSG